MQEVFAIPVVDEIKSDNSSDAEDDNNNDDENNIDELQNGEFINDEDIQSIQPEDLDKLFTAEKIA